MTPIEKVLACIAAKSAGKRKWSGRCPSHDDRSPSLSIREGDDGRALLYCHAGCSVEAVVAAIDLEIKDLFPESATTTASDTQQKFCTREEGEHALTQGVQQREGQEFRLVHAYDYDVMGGGTLRVLRFEDAKGNKTIRQMSGVADKWVLRGPKAPVLPYKHEGVRDAKCVWVVEGEKCVQALAVLGIAATTSAGGSKAASKTCWDALQGKDLVLLPDNDAPGRQYICDVRDLARPSSSKIVELPGLGAGEDIADYVATRKAEGHSDDQIRADLIALVEETEPDEAQEYESAREPFPLEFLPPAVAQLVRSVAESRCVDITAVASLAIAGMGTAIGLSRIAWDEYSDWEEVPVFWLALVSRTGTRKSTLITDLFGPHMARQHELAQKFDAEQAAYQQELDSWKQREKKNKTGEAEPRPSEPKLVHVYTSDSTSEMLLQILEDSPRGIVVINDELTTFFKGMGRYGGKAEHEQGLYLSLFRGVQLKKDRCSSGTILIDKAVASIVGGVQPLVLKGCFDEGAFASGMASRFLLVFPEPQVKRYAQGPSRAEKDDYAAFIEKLFNLKMEPYCMPDGEVGTRPQRVPFADDARDLLAEFIPNWSAEGLASAPNVGAAMSKLEGYAIRFALLIRVCREVDGGGIEEPITRADLEQGIRLARWYRDEALRVYAELGKEDGEAGSETLLGRMAVIRDRFDGAVTCREWHKVNNRRPRDVADRELDELVEAGLAQWRERPPGPRGGQPTRECALMDPDPGPEEVAGCGLRGAGIPVENQNGRERVVRGDREDLSGEGCNPQPPSITTPPISKEGGVGDQRSAGSMGAPRNPQPGTPREDPKKEDLAPAADGVQPTTPNSNDFLQEMFDGSGATQVEAVETVPVREVFGPRESRPCYMCKSRRWWRLLSGGQWTCESCHPPTYEPDLIEFHEEPGDE